MAHAGPDVVPGSGRSKASVLKASVLKASVLKALPVTVGRVYEPPLLAAWGLEALTARMAAAAAAWSELPAGGQLDDDRRAGLQGALVALVDEGSPAEAPLLRRAESLRRQLRTAEEAAVGADPDPARPRRPGRLAGRPGAG